MKIEGEMRLLDGGSIVFIISGTMFTNRCIWIDKRIGTKTPDRICWGMAGNKDDTELSPYWLGRFREAMKAYQSTGLTDSTGRTEALRILRGT